jgi:hypothetical protein
VSVVNDWQGVLDSLVETPDIREWVLQRYIDNPLLFDGHKFHLRVYVLCIGALKVYVYENILVLFAAHKYNVDDLSDIYSHLTNTALSANDVDFDERRFVKLLSEELPPFKGYVSKIKEEICSITGELFSAFENEYTVFSPMLNCFELFGLDFMVDEEFKVHLLEVNPGPDFKQTGNALQAVIENLWEETCSLVIDAEQLGLNSNPNTRFLTKVYDKPLSVANCQGGMKMV